MALVHAVGINDLDEPISYAKNGKRKMYKFYSVWYDMLTRCYCPKYQERQPTYKGVTVCEDWHKLSVFKKWFNENYVEGYCLDKDLKVKGNKIYSAETCVFVPQPLNNLLLEKPALNRKLPVGVEFHKQSKKFKAKLSNKGKTTHIGLFNTPEEAHKAYLETKHKYVLQELENYNEVNKELIVILKNRYELLTKEDS